MDPVRTAEAAAVSMVNQASMDTADATQEDLIQRGLGGEEASTSSNPVNWAAGGEGSQSQPTQAAVPTTKGNNKAQEAEELALMLEAQEDEYPEEGTKPSSGDGKEGESKSDVQASEQASSAPDQALPESHATQEPNQEEAASSPLEEGRIYEMETGADEDAEDGMFDAAEASFVIDTAGDMDVDREVALEEDQSKKDRSNQHMENGLLLPDHVNVVSSSAANGDGHGSNGKQQDDTFDADAEGELGSYEQLDGDPNVENRYYGVEEKMERRAKEICTACGEMGHDRRHCPHEHCLACGAMDEHPTRLCPMSTSCFRCGQVGHQTRTCPKPRRARGGIECQKCGSESHAETICPLLWRLYAYNKSKDHLWHRSKMFYKYSKGGKPRPLSDMDPDPEERSDSEQEFHMAGEPPIPASKLDSGWDPVDRWCYNCSARGNHWGDDCPDPRTNPTRTNGEYSAFSEFVSRWGPFANSVPSAPPLAGYRMPSTQFTFSVGDRATMHVEGGAASSSNRSSNSVGATKFVLGKHIVGGPPENAPKGPKGRGTNVASSSTQHGIDHLNELRDTKPSELVLGDSSTTLRYDGEEPSGFRFFGSTKALYFQNSGYVTPKDLNRGYKPLPENLFREWLVSKQEEESGSLSKIKRSLDDRAERDRAVQSSMESLPPSGRKAKTKSQARRESNPKKLTKKADRLAHEADIAKRKEAKKERQKKKRERRRQKQEVEEADNKRKSSSSSGGGDGIVAPNEPPTKKRKDAKGQPQSQPQSQTKESAKQAQASTGTASNPINVDDRDRDRDSKPSKGNAKKRNRSSGSSSDTQQQQQKKKGKSTSAKPHTDQPSTSTRATRSRSARNDPKPAGNRSAKASAGGSGSMFHGGYF